MATTRILHKFSPEEMEKHKKLLLEEVAEILQLEQRIKSMKELLESRKNRLNTIVYEIQDGGKWI